MKIGDVVKVKTTGKVGHISNIQANTKYPYDVIIMGKPKSMPFSKKELVLVAEQH